MSTRRAILINGLALGASAFAGDRLVVAKRKPRNRRLSKSQIALTVRYVVAGTNEIELDTYFFLTAIVWQADLNHLANSRNPIQLAIPANLEKPYDRSFEFWDPEAEFNHRGYRIVRRPRYGVNVPITGRPKRAIRIVVRVQQNGFNSPHFPNETSPSGSFVGKGKPGRWIWLRPAGKRR